MKKKDVWLVGIILCIAFLLYWFFSKDVMGDQVIITLNGTEYGTYSLKDNQEITVSSDMGYNKVVISDGMVYVKDADCPDRYCVRQGGTDNQRKSLICLPHKLVVEVRLQKPEKNGEVDAVAQ